MTRLIYANIPALRALTCAAALACGSPVLAGPADEVIDVEVLPGWQTETGTRMVGLRLTLAPGWKTYWRAPGEGGIPPLFDWSGTSNVAGLRLHWPVPDVWDQGGMRSFVYRDQVVIPVELTQNDGDAPVTLAGAIDLGVCDDICLPVTLTFAADLPAGGARDGEIVAALVDRPLNGAEAGVGAVACSIGPAAQGIELTARIAVPPTGGEEAVVFEPGDPQIWVSPVRSAREGDVLVARAQLVHVGGAGFALDRSALRITVLGSDHAVDIVGCSGS